jgi:hypothetical protein
MQRPCAHRSPSPKRRCLPCNNALPQIVDLVRHRSRPVEDDKCQGQECREGGLRSTGSRETKHSGHSRKAGGRPSAPDCRPPGHMKHGRKVCQRKPQAGSDIPETRQPVEIRAKAFLHRPHVLELWNRQLPKLVQGSRGRRRPSESSHRTGAGSSGG